MREHARLFLHCIGDHHQERGILDLIDAAASGGCQHISAALDQGHIQIVPPHVPHGQKCAGCKPGSLPQIALLPEGNDLSPAVRVPADILDQPVHQVVSLHCRAIPLPDRPVSDIPGIPPGHSVFFHFRKFIGRMLVDREYLPDPGLPRLSAQGADGKFSFCEIIPAHYVVDADRMRRCPVLINGPGILVPEPVLQYIADITDKIRIRLCHDPHSFCAVPYCPGTFLKQTYSCFPGGPRPACALPSRHFSEINLQLPSLRASVRLLDFRVSQGRRNLTSLNTFKKPVLSSGSRSHPHPQGVCRLK